MATKAEGEADIEIRESEMTLDDLVGMDQHELDELFVKGDTPEIDDLQGFAEGRVLSGELLPDIEGVRNLANLSVPWQGKVFRNEGDIPGGANKLDLGVFETEQFEFEMYVGPSLKSDDEVVTLDYNLPQNPPVIRRIRDDLKQVGDSLYLGTANLRTGDSYRFLSYWAVEV